MPRVLGVDHGTKRIGIAVSDELKMIAPRLFQRQAKKLFEKRVLIKLL